MSNYYYYLHTNGDLIGKPPLVVESDPLYFESTFVRKVWNIDLSNRSHAWGLVLEALALGANIDRVKELATKWKLDYTDCKVMIINIDPNDDLRAGLALFITNILNMDYADFWNTLRDKREVWT